MIEFFNFNVNLTNCRKASVQVTQQVHFVEHQTTLLLKYLEGKIMVGVGYRNNSLYYSVGAGKYLDNRPGTSRVSVCFYEQI